MIITVFSEFFFVCVRLFLNFLSTSTCMSDFCMMRCENGIISTCYPSGELMPYTGSVPFKYSADSSKLPTLSLREAARTKKDQLKCNCTKDARIGIVLVKDLEVIIQVTAIQSVLVQIRSAMKQLMGMRSVERVTGADDCDDINELKVKKNRKRVTTAKHKTEATMIKSVQSGDWLDDTHMDAASSLLSSQFPSLCGLYSTLLRQNLSFPVTRESFIQILNAGGNHWITVQHTQSFSVNVFDSKFSTIPMDVKMQIAALLCCSSSRITTRVPKTQSQMGSSDCGVFAIAFATDLAFGLNPASHYYEQDKLRPHFIECLKSQQMTPFPSKNIQPGKPNTEYLYVYCHCRMPDDGKERMAQCTGCKEWYHESCENIPQAVFKDDSHDWKCKVCIARETQSA